MGCEFSRLSGRCDAQLLQAMTRDSHSHRTGSFPGGRNEGEGDSFVSSGKRSSRLRLFSHRNCDIKRRVRLLNTVVVVFVVVVVRVLRVRVLCVCA